MGDVTDAIDNEVNLLQNKLRETLREEEERGANIQSLGSRAEHLESRAGMFQSEARETRNKLWWRSFKWSVLIIAIILLIVYILYRLILK